VNATSASPGLLKGSQTVDAHGEPRFLEQVKLFFESGASKTGIEPQWLNLIKACQTVVRFNIPLRRDNGNIEVVTCYR
jgi:glutamate dehydrogenase/leucine dehydrogenase